MKRLRFQPSRSPMRKPTSRGSLDPRRRLLPAGEQKRSSITPLPFLYWVEVFLLKIAALIVSLIGGVAACIVGVLRILSPASSTSTIGALGLMGVLFGLATIAIAAFVIRRNPAVAGVEILIFGTVCLLLHWPTAVVVLLGAVLAMMAVVETYGRAPIKIVATIIGVLGGAPAMVLGMMRSAAIFAEVGRASGGPAAIGKALVAAFVSGPGILLAAGGVAAIGVTTLTSKHPVASGILVLVAAAASFLFLWPAALALLAAGALALLGATEKATEGRAGTQGTA